MGRCTVIRWAFAAGVLCCWGCSAQKSFGPLGWMHGPSASQTTASKDEPNPLKSSDSSAASASTSKADGATAVRAAADTDTGGGGFKSAAIDPALSKLMEDELQSEPPAEREKLYKEWSKFDSAFIRELVENHRMARELAESHNGAKSASGVKTASVGGPGDMSAFDEPAAPKVSAAPKSGGSSGPIRQAGATSLGAVSPWDDAPDTSAATAAQAPRRPASVAASEPPSMPSTLDSGVSSNSVRPLDSASADRSLVISPGTVHDKGGPKDIAAAAVAPAALSTAASETPISASSQAPKPDAFAGLTPVDTEPSPGSAAAPTAAVRAPASIDGSPRILPSHDGPGSMQLAATNGFGDGPSIQPGTAPPAGVITGLQPGRNSTASPVQTVSASPFDDPPAAPASGTRAKTTQANALDSEQPIKLGGPIDIPEGSVVAASDPGTGNSRASQASATSRSTPTTPASTTTPAAPQPSGLASLPSRLLGAINPLPGNGSRNIALPANWHEELQKIVTAAASEAGQTSVGSSDAEKLAYIQKQVNVRMLYLLSGQPARSLEPIAGLEPADQEFWQQVFWGMSNYFDRAAIADPSDRATQTIAQLRAAVHKLQEKSKLELRNVSFCNKIENYGRYERFKRDEFTPGQPVLLYAEVDNFKSEPTADGPYRAILKSTIEIFDSRGAIVQKMPFQPTEDLCASPRRDYYNSYEFVVPTQISLGPHTLKLTVEDQLSQKVASYTVNFTVK
jgi:hypothetical protein